MSALTWIRKNAKTIAKGSLYVGGGLALGLPVIRGAQRLWDGGTLDDAATTVIWEATGYGTDINKVYMPKLREVVVRDLVGAGAIYAASKL